MRQYNTSWLLALFLCLPGCLAMGVEDSNDPDTLIKTGYYSMAQLGRKLPASRAFLKALDIYTERGDRHGQAEAWLGIGQLLKHGPASVGPVDPRLEGMEKAYPYQQAIAIWKKDHAYMDVAAAYFGMANAHVKSNPARACQDYKASLRYYQKGIENGQVFRRLRNPNFDDFPSAVKAFQKKYCAHS